MILNKFIYTFLISTLIFALNGKLFAQKADLIIKETSLSFEVKKISNLNTKYAEFSPVLFDNRLIFVSDRPYDLINIGEDQWNKRKFLNVFVGEVQDASNDSVIIDKQKIFMKELIGVNHTGPISISADGKKIIYSQVSRVKKSINKPKLYEIEFREGKWQKPKMLEFCSEESSFAHPSLNKDGTVLYFSSDKSGGRGGKDIYYSIYDGNKWSDPFNAGDSVNTEKDELFPCWNNNFLYYSSNCKQSIGGLDLFRTNFDKFQALKKENLGATINTAEDDFGICFTGDFKHAFFTSNRIGSKGDDLYFAKIIETVTVESKEIAGRFTFRNLKESVNGIEVLLLDDKGEIVQRTKTNSSGDFIFRKLNADENYTIRTISNDPNMELEIIDKNGVAVAIYRSDKNGSFLYKKLDPALVGSLSLMEIEDGEMGKTGKLSGQFIYEKLPGVYPDGLEVFLIDASGNIVQKTKTDGYGNFMFRKLNLNENYFLKVADQEDDLVLLVYNNTESVIAELLRDKNGNYLFRKLNIDAVSDLKLIATIDDTGMVARKYITLAGQFKFKNLEGVVSEMPFVLTDVNGNILFKGKTDQKGFFRVRDLVPADQYIFQLDQADAGFDKKYILDIYNRRGRSLALLENDKMGRFIFKKLKQEFFYLQEISANDIEFIERVPSIYFESNQSTLSPDSKIILDRVAKIMLDHPDLKLEISGFADSRASEQYNLTLSQKRMNAVKSYLISKGVRESKMIGHFYGEARLVNNCKDGENCEDKLHRLNRRCEMHILSSK